MPTRHDELRRLSEVIGGWVVNDADDAVNRAAFVLLWDWAPRFRGVKGGAGFDLGFTATFHTPSVAAPIPATFYLTLISLAGLSLMRRKPE